MAKKKDEKKDYIDLEELFSNGPSSNAPSPSVSQYSPQQWASPNMAANNNFFNNTPTPSISNMNMSMNILSQLPIFKQQLLATLAQQLNNHSISHEEYTAKAKTVLDPNYMPENMLKRPQDHTTFTPNKQLKMDPNINISQAMMAAKTPQQIASLQRWASSQNQMNPNINPNFNPNLGMGTRSNMNKGEQVPLNIQLSTPYTAPAPISFNVSKPASSSKVNTPQQSEVELDIEGMMDVTNYAGVDLKEEEFSLNELSVVGVSALQSSFTDIPFLDIFHLEKKCKEIGKPLFNEANSHAVQFVDSSFTSFVSKAADNYILNLLTEMCKTADHRSIVDYEVFCAGKGTGTSTEYDLEIFEEDDVKLKLIELETKEREEQERLIEIVGLKPVEEGEGGIDPQSSTNFSSSNNPSISVMSSQISAQSKLTSIQSKLTIQSDDSKKLKPKKVSSKKELPEAIKNKMTNSAALMATGGTMKSWMLPGATISVPSPKIVTNDSITGHNDPTAQPSAIVRAGSRLRPQKRITIKDALFVMEGKRELKSNELVYKWWANVK